jgi:hypothetical protein
VRTALVVFVVLFLIASTANLIAAILLYLPGTRSFPMPWGRPSTGAAAATNPWPGPTPHAQPWPTISSWTELRSFGRQRIDARGAASSEESFSMQVDRSGWPLPVLQHSERWWPWDHPNWKLPSNSQDAGFSLLLPGLVVNPLAGASAAWLAIFGPVLLWRAVLAHRRGPHQCRKCGYDLRGLEPNASCPECGSARRAVVPAPTAA